MKKLFLNLFILTGLLLVTSCSDDDSDNDSVELEGTWRLTALNAEQSYDLNNDGTASANLLDEINCLTNETISFADGTAIYMTTSYIDDIEFVSDGEGETDGMFVVDCEQEIANTPVTYERNGNTVVVTITFEDDGEIFEEELVILTISGNTISFTEEDEFEIYGDDFETIAEENLTYVFTKQ